MKTTLLVGLLLLAAPVSAQTWPPRIQQIVDALAAQHPDLTDRSSDEKRRELTRLFAEQAEFEKVDGLTWGTKRYGGGPPSADMLCMRQPLLCWDWSLPSGIARYPDGMSLGGDPQQIYISVTGRDHLGVGVPPPPDPGLPPPVVILPPPADAAQLDRIEQKLDAVKEDTTAIRGGLGRAWRAIAKYATAPVLTGILTFIFSRDDNKETP